MKGKDCAEYVQDTISEEDANFLLKYAKEFKKQTEVKYLYNSFKSASDFKEYRLFVLIYAIIKAGDYRILFEDDNSDFDITRIHVTNKHNHICRLTRILELKSHAILFNATLMNEKQSSVIVKYYRKGEKDVREENDYYVRMREAGAELPWCSTTFHLFGQPILVLEKLDQLCKDDNEFKMGYDILNQLQVLHKRVETCHSDLKLGNVMRISNTNKYTVIDFGGCPRERVKNGWLRRCHTPLVTSQKKGVKDQVMTEWHDFMELCFTMKMIQNLRDRKTACQKDEKNDYVRTGFEGLLKTCVDFVNSLDKYSIREEHYDQFRSLLIRGFTS